MRTEEGMPTGIIRSSIGGKVYCTVCKTNMSTGNAQKHSNRHLAAERREQARVVVMHAIEIAEFVGSRENCAFTKGSESRIIMAEMARRDIFKETEEDMR